MPHFKPVQSGIDKLPDLVVRQQHGITAGITGMRNDTDSPGLFDGTNHISGIRRRSGNVVRAARTDSAVERRRAIRIRPRSDQRIRNMRPADRRLIAFANLSEHIIPSNRVILGNQPDHALRALKSGLTKPSEQSTDLAIVWIVLVCEHMNRHAVRVCRHFSAPHQMQAALRGSRCRIIPTCGGVMISDRNPVQPQCARFTNHIRRCLPPVGEDGVTVQIPPFGWWIISDMCKSHITIVSWIFATGQRHAQQRGAHGTSVISVTSEEGGIVSEQTTPKPQQQRNSNASAEQNAVIPGWRHGSTWTYLIMLLASAAALFVSFMLSAETLRLARRPNQLLACDINNVVSCSQVAQSWQAELVKLGDLSFPNAFFGIAAESVFVTIAVIGLARVRVPRWFATCTWLGGLAALLFSYWLTTQSLFVIHALCPWCLALMFSTTIQFMALSHATVTVQDIPHGKRGLRTYYRLNYDLMADVVWVLAIIALILVKDGSAIFR